MTQVLRTRKPIVYVAIAFLLMLALFALPARLVELLWFDNLGYGQVFWRTLGLKGGLFVFGFALAALYFGLNFLYIYRRFSVVTWHVGLTVVRSEGPELELTPTLFRGLAAGVTVFLSLFFGLYFRGLYDSYIRFRGDVQTGIVDPIFGVDVSFYLLRLPFIESLQSVFLTLSALTIAVSVGAFVWMGSFMVDRGSVVTPPPVVRLITANLIVFIAAWAVGYFLRRYELLFASGGTVHGIGYVDHHIMIPALWIMIGASILVIALLVANLQRARLALIGVSVAGYFLVMLIGLVIVPVIVQRMSVEPNELQREYQYIENNIRFTRLAYGIDDVREEAYPALQNLTYESILDNDETIANIRLWDPRLLIQTFRQIQEIRTYYQFYNVDIDRYVIDGQLTQVMLAGRELAQRLPSRADTWINRHMQYTHGYGVTMNAVAEVGPEGNPELLIRDLPPVSLVDIPVRQPAIYYGEAVPTYRIVNTDVPELAYPSGDENVYTHYAGTGGVQLSSFWRRILFAIYHGDTNVILSDLIHSESRIQFWNRIQERITRIAPFLRLDQDPYLVVTENGLVWIQDAYTTARTYPYSEPTPGAGLNYIRNSVKVVVDAFEGSVTFYVTDPDDPIIGAYRRFFPDLFRDIDELPLGLEAHLRYPQDLFDIQVARFTRYHMTIPQVFYNNEDLWTRPVEQYGGRAIRMEPYYVLTKLPGEEDLEFLLMTPLTPEARDNMIAWMAARSDPGRYGELVVYKLPKERLIYGPSQIESRIDQNTEISQQLALWDQRGSRVIRGNLMVIPIEESFLYVEPVFLIADGTQIPQLRRVIALFGERVAMEETLDEALASVFQADLGARVMRGEFDPDAVPGLQTVRAQQDLRRAREALNRAMTALQQGDFSLFGDRIRELQRILDEPEAEAPDEAAPPVAPALEPEGQRE
jgi:uncharacterized protein